MQFLIVTCISQTRDRVTCDCQWSFLQSCNTANDVFTQHLFDVLPFEGVRLRHHQRLIDGVFRVAEDGWLDLDVFIGDLNCIDQLLIATVRVGQCLEDTGDALQTTILGSGQQTFACQLIRLIDNCRACRLGSLIGGQHVNIDSLSLDLLAIFRILYGFLYSALLDFIKFFQLFLKSRNRDVIILQLFRHAWIVDVHIELGSCQTAIIFIFDNFNQSVVGHFGLGWSFDWRCGLMDGGQELQDHQLKHDWIVSHALGLDCRVFTQSV